MSKRLTTVLLLLAAGLAALVSSGCGSTAATIDPVAEAAVATSHAGGAQMSMHATIEIRGLNSPMTLSGSGNFNFTHSEGEIVTSLTGLPSAAAGLFHGSSIHVTELYAGGELYMQSPLLDGKLPNGARWIKLDLAKLAQASGLDLQSLTSGQSNPAQILDYLKASGGRVTRVGSATIRGTQTTHYRGTIDLTEAIRKAAGTSSATLPVEVWVDDHNLVRRISLTLAESPAGSHVKVTFELELFNFGSTPSVNQPSSGEVFDATQSSLAAIAGGS